MRAARGFRAAPAGVLLAVLLTAPSVAPGEPLDADAKRIVEARVASVVPASAKLTIAEGHTVLLEARIEVKGSRLKARETDYEGLVTGIVSPEGVVVHPRLDSFRFEPGPGKTVVHVVYAMHVDPTTRNGGRVKANLAIVERRGLANVIAKKPITHWVKIGRPAPTQTDLRADFEGYRLYAASAQSERRTLAQNGLRLSLKDNARMPPLSRASRAAVARAYRYEQARRRMWIAHRHLVTASSSRDQKIAAAARAYLANLDKPDNKVSGLPKVSLRPQSAAPPPPPPTSSAASGSDTLEPVASEPAGPERTGRGKNGEVLAPVATYDPNVERGADTQLPESRSPRPDTPPPPAAPPPAPERAPETTTEPDEELIYETTTDPFSGRTVRRYRKIPGYTRGLVLDDVNIAHGAAFRMAWADVTLRESAVATAFFFEAQASLARWLGLELTVPTEFVSLDVDRARNVFALGNPLLALKWRTHLPKVLGRRPALTMRVRGGIPISPVHKIPPTEFDAEEFTREAHFADTYAFNLEKGNLGLGAALAWKWQWLRIGAQVYADYFIPVRDALDTTDFLTISWGASVGALPFGDIIGVFAEARAVSLVAGAQRTEFFTYFGARGRVFDYLEPAVWVAVPLGSVRDANPYQIGVELRFSYDVYDVVDPGGRGNRDDVQILE